MKRILLATAFAMSTTAVLADSAPQMKVGEDLIVSEANANGLNENLVVWGLAALMLLILLKGASGVSDPV